MRSAGAKVRAVAAEIVDAVATAGQSLDAALAEHEDRVTQTDRSLLRMLCFGTLRYHWRSQTGEATRHLRRPKLAGLVNACLRRFMREDIAASDPEDETARWNHPQWLIDRLKTDWPEDWQAILTANDERAPMWLRANAARYSAEAYLTVLADAGIAAALLPGLPDAVCLQEPRSVDDLPGFSDGDSSVQDAAAQIAGRWLSTDLHGRLLDACAAPGG